MRSENYLRAFVLYIKKNYFPNSKGNAYLIWKSCKIEKSQRTAPYIVNVNILECLPLKKMVYMVNILILGAHIPVF